MTETVHVKEFNQVIRRWKIWRLNSITLPHWAGCKSVCECMQSIEVQCISSRHELSSFNTIFNFALHSHCFVMMIHKPLCNGTNLRKNGRTTCSGLAENLTHMVFRQPFVIQTCYNTIINLLKLKFLMFLYSRQHEINFCCLMLLCFLLLHSCYLVILVTKIHE